MPDPVTASIEIAAEPERVFEYFTRSELMLRWMGERAQLEPAPGGAFPEQEATRHQAGWRRFLVQLATAAADVLSK